MKIIRLSIVMFIFGAAIMPLLHPRVQAQEDTALTLWIAPGVPSEFQGIIQLLIDTGAYEAAQTREAAQITLEITTDSDTVVSSQWIYVPVVPFASTTDSIRASDIEFFWKGEAPTLTEMTDGSTVPTLYVTQQTRDALASIYGEPSATRPIEVIPAEAMIQKMWDARPNAWAILPFHALTPEFKVLSVDGIDIFAPNFDANTYPLQVKIGALGETEALGHLVDDLLESALWQSTNRDSSKLTRVVLTGVTAMTRATAYKMETVGMTYPAEGIMPFIQDADILHTSNEVPFSENCPPADPFLSTTIFCSDDSYMELLTHIGLDVVELTGNHVNDYGPGAFRHSLEMYEEAGIAIFGGGYTPEDARDAYVTEHNGNSIAFIGCNVPGPTKALVSADRVGAAPCDDTFLSEELPRLASEVDILIMTVQQWEFPRYSVGAEQLRQFTDYANLGADLVMGSQAHQPQGFSFVQKEGQLTTFMHHGLGNLFFDQMNDIGTRQMFIDKVIVYDGRIISVVLYTGMMEDYCCSRPMTPEERINFLNTIFAASGW